MAAHHRERCPSAAPRTLQARNEEREYLLALGRSTGHLYFPPGMPIFQSQLLYSLPYIFDFWGQRFIFNLLLQKRKLNYNSTFVHIFLLKFVLIAEPARGSHRRPRRGQKRRAGNFWLCQQHRHRSLVVLWISKRLSRKMLDSAVWTSVKFSFVHLFAGLFVVCLFVCLFTCSLTCLVFVCLFVYLFNCAVFICVFANLFVCLFLHSDCCFLWFFFGVSLNLLAVYCRLLVCCYFVFCCLSAVYSTLHCSFTVCGFVNCNSFLWSFILSFDISVTFCIFPNFASHFYLYVSFSCCFSSFTVQF